MLITRDQRRQWGLMGAQARYGKGVCVRCGHPLYPNNRSHLCRACVRKWGLPTLEKRVKPLQELHLRICRDPQCQHPAHFANCVSARPQRPSIDIWGRRVTRASRSKAQSNPVFMFRRHNVILDGLTLIRLGRRALAKSGQLGCRISKSDLIREALKEWFRNHPDTEFFADVRP